MCSIVPVFIPHLGCVHRCVFCDQRAIAADAAPAPRQVEEQIERALAYAKTPQIAFYGGSFTAIEDRLQEAYLNAAQHFVDAGQADGIRLSTRPDCVDETVILRLKRYSVQTVELGAQSMKDHVLRASKRGHTAEDTARAARRLKQAGFQVVLQMMVGLPESTPGDERQTAEALCALSPGAVRIYPVCVIAGTELCGLYEQGKYIPPTLEQAVELCADLVPVFETQGISVLRIGLNPTEQLSGGAVLAGAYHPALGQLVRSRIWLREASAMLEKIGGGKVRITVPRGQLPVAVGQKRCNVQALREQNPHLEIMIAEDGAQREKMKISVG